MIDSMLIVDEARTWIGTPYVLQGRVKMQGVDCVGHIAEVGRVVGAIPLQYSIPAYHADVDGNFLLEECDRMLTRIGEIELGAVIASSFPGRQLPQHLAIVGNYRHGGYSMIQALSTASGKGRVVEHTLNSAAEKRIVAIYRYRQT